MTIAKALFMHYFTQTATDSSFVIIQPNKLIQIQLEAFEPKDIYIPQALLSPNVDYNLKVLADC